jgi:hypothetical protein
MDSAYGFNKIKRNKPKLKTEFYLNLNLVVPPWFVRQTLVYKNDATPRKSEVGIKVGDSLHCVSKP